MSNCQREKSERGPANEPRADPSPSWDERGHTASFVPGTNVSPEQSDVTSHHASLPPTLPVTRTCSCGRLGLSLTLFVFFFLWFVSCVFSPTRLYVCVSGSRNHSWSVPYCVPVALAHQSWWRGHILNIRRTLGHRLLTI